VMASPSQWNHQIIRTQVPQGATTGPVVVTVGNRSSNGVTFTVTESDSEPDPDDPEPGTSPSTEPPPPPPVGTATRFRQRCRSVGLFILGPDRNQLHPERDPPGRIPRTGHGALPGREPVRGGRVPNRQLRLSTHGSFGGNAGAGIRRGRLL
jgi:hypothetical protein